MTEAETVNVILVNRATGEPAALLVEREPGIVEFPVLTLACADPDDEHAVVAAIRGLTGLDATITSFLDGDQQRGMAPLGGRFLLARVAGGTPQLSVAHSGWEWRPLARLLELPFIPKYLANELRSYMYG